MKIKMLTTKSGPIANENWHEGQIRTVCDDEGEYWIKFGVASIIEKSVIAPVEKATIAPTQKAVVAPSEVSEKGKAKGDAPNPPVAPPARSGNAIGATPASSSAAVSSAKAQTWGTQEVK